MKKQIISFLLRISLILAFLTCVTVFVPLLFAEVAFRMMLFFLVTLIWVIVGKSPFNPFEEIGHKSFAVMWIFEVPGIILDKLSMM